MKLDLSKITALVGENSIGKTNILMAIYKILKMDESPQRIDFSIDDFYYDETTKERSDEIIIQLNFAELDDNDISAFLWGGINVSDNGLSIRLIAKFEEENSDTNVEVLFYREDDKEDPTGEKFQTKYKRFIPFYYINAYRDIWKETEDSRGDLKQIFKDHNKNFLKPLNIQRKRCIGNIDIYLKDNNETEIKEVIEALKDIQGNLQDQI